MEKFKWTPGPWKTSLTDDTFVRSADNDVAVMIGDYSDDVTSLIMTANANLIAAAPDLYAATDWDWLIELENEALDDDQGGNNDFPIKLTVGQIRALMRARRKARGE